MVCSHFGELHPDLEDWIRALAREYGKRRGRAGPAVERQMRNRLGAHLAKRAARMSLATWGNRDEPEAGDSGAPPPGCDEPAEGGLKELAWKNEGDPYEVTLPTVAEDSDGEEEEEVREAAATAGAGGGEDSAVRAEGAGENGGHQPAAMEGVEMDGVHASLGGVGVDGQGWERSGGAGGGPAAATDGVAEPAAEAAGGAARAWVEVCQGAGSYTRFSKPDPPGPLREPAPSPLLTPGQGQGGGNPATPASGRRGNDQRRWVQRQGGEQQGEARGTPPHREDARHTHSRSGRRRA